MAKITRAQRRGLESALASVNRAIAYVEDPRVAVCRAGEINAAVPLTGDGSPGHEYRAGAPYRSQEYTGRDDSTRSIDWIKTLTPTDKGIGSNLVAIYTARDTLQALLTA